MELLKAKNKNIKEIRRFTPEELKGKTRLDFNYWYEVGYYIPTNANWAYTIVMVEYMGYLLPVIVQFGHII